MTNEEKAQALIGNLVELYEDALKQLKTQTACDACGQKSYNASLMREAREFLKQHNIELDPNSAPMQHLETAADDLAQYRRLRGRTS